MGIAEGQGSCACATAWTAAQETGGEIAPHCGREQVVRIKEHKKLRKDVGRAGQESQALMIPFLC